MTNNSKSICLEQIQDKCNNNNTEHSISHIIIVDFGSQFTSLIARRIRELEFCSILCNEKNFKFIPEKTLGIILSGSHESISSGVGKNLISIIMSINEQYGTPILGICYGKQLICNYFGSIVESKNSEYGYTQIDIDNNSKFFGINDFFSDKKKFPVWMSHGDSVKSLPKNFTIIASSSSCNSVAVENKNRNIFGLQFHPEVEHTKFGLQMIKNFLSICNYKENWNIKELAHSYIEKIKRTVGNKKVIAAVSGGVDSSVASVLVHKAIGENLKCIFIDTGLMRKNEVQDVVLMLKEKLKINLHVVDASAIFFEKLKSVECPEEKRKIIGELFIRIFEEQQECEEFLLQGTLYSDIIESGGTKGAKIKSHHNVGGLPEDLNFTLLEPLKFLFKDEVRKLGKELLIDHSVLYRHPFPGPGLAVRLPGIITRERVKILQDIDDIYITMLKERGFYNKIWQAFAVLLPVKTVGVMGDKRMYGYACTLRAVTATDAMTSGVFPIESNNEVDYKDFWLFLRDVSTKIINDVNGVNRILFDITSKPPGTIEWE